MLKDHQAVIAREKQHEFVMQSKAVEERSRLEQEKKQDLAADFSFSEEVRQTALRKLETAAFKFDPNKSAKLEGFDVDFMKPYFFR